MTPEQFVYWLQGALEIMDPKQLDEKQIQVIKDHITLVLKKETPNRLPFDILTDPSMKPGEVKITTLPYKDSMATFPACSGLPTCGCLLCSSRRGPLIATC